MENNYYNCMSYTEIAKELNISVDKVKRIERIALRKIAKNFPELKLLLDK